MGSVGRGRQLRTSSTPVQTPLAVRTFVPSAARPARQGDEGLCQGSPGSAQ